MLRGCFIGINMLVGAFATLILRCCQFNIVTGDTSHSASIIVGLPLCEQYGDTGFSVKQLNFSAIKHVRLPDIRG